MYAKIEESIHRISAIIWSNLIQWLNFCNGILQKCFICNKLFTVKGLHSACFYKWLAVQTWYDYPFH